MMTAADIGLQLTRARLRAGLTQVELAARIGTTQSAVSRVEAGRTLPSIAYIDRVARATGRPISITIGGDEPSDDRVRRDRVRRAFRGYRFDPWARDPSEAEARTLEADGLTRERFKRP